MDAKHTPGPWVIKTNKAGYPYAINAPLQSSRRPGGITDITRWGSISMPSSPEGQANARLIAAAPDMAKALNAVSIALRAQIDAGAPEYVADALRIADAAIAKATSA